MAFDFNQRGRFFTETYSPFTANGEMSASFPTNLVKVQPTSPLLKCVNSLTYYWTTLQLSVTSGSTLVAKMNPNMPPNEDDTNVPLVAWKRPSNAGIVVALNYFPLVNQVPPQPSPTQYWDPNTDGNRLFQNAIRFAAA
jgi:hypothetical protein